MTLTLTEAARNAIEQVNVTPQVVFIIDGVDTIFGADRILKYVRIGDPGLVIGDSWRIGGLNEVEDQASLISFGGEGGGTTTKIVQNLNLDRGEGSSVSQMQISLIDKGDQITQLLSPGTVVEDLLGRKAKVMIGFAGTGYPQDYLKIFAGIISEIDSGSGLVSLQLDHPDSKKLADIFRKQSTKLDGAINASQTTIDLVSAANFLEPVLGPDGNFDTNFHSAVRIGSELIRYTGISGSSLTGCTRGYLGTTAASHDDESDVESFYRIMGDAMTVALKLMMSGFGGAFQSDVAVTSFNGFESLLIDNAVYFEGIDVAEEYGVVKGDYLTIEDATNVGNNFTNREILDISTTEGGSYMVVDGAALTLETTTVALASFRSKYDTLPDGLQMSGDQVDVMEHELMRARFLSAFEYDFYLKDTINGREFIERQVYLPAAAFSIPRKSKASVGYTIAPFPGTEIPILTRRNIRRPSQIHLKRSISKNFINTVIYKFDERELENEFATSTVTLNPTAIEQVKIGSRSLTIEAKGIRSQNQGVSRTSSASVRKLNVYKVGAESMSNLEPLPGVSIPIEIGDTVLLNTEGLKVSNSEASNRDGFQRLYRVDNKSFDIKTGITQLSLVDTGFDEASRYALISPASIVQSVVSLSRITVIPSFSKVFGTSEFRKWNRLTLPSVRIRAPDFSTIYYGNILRWEGNDAIFDTALAGPPSAGWIMEFDSYNDLTDEQKFIYGSMTDAATFDDSKPQYRML